MEVIKLTKKMLRLHPLDLLVKLDAVNLDKKMTYPQHVYFSKEDYKELKENLKIHAKKLAPLSHSRLLAYAVNMDLLNYGPNETLKEALKPGWALVDRESINKE